MTLQTPQGALASATMSSLRAYFDAATHRPSAEHWHALGAIADTMEAMANGACPAKVFLSAVDPGVGKSQTVIHYSRALMASEAHRAVGMVICVGRVAEAVAIATELASHREHVGVLTADPKANALGCPVPHEAQVLVTTQQRIELVTKDRTFADVAAFHYRGAPRAVRVWDESWLPGMVVTVDSYDLLGLLSLVSKVSPDLADAIKVFADALAVMPDGEAVAVPDFADVCNGSLYDVLSTLSEAGAMRDDQKQTTTGLMIMSGKVARVSRDTGLHRRTMLTYKDTLPDDLRPLLVLDASGRVRQTYADIEAHRLYLTRLPEAVKNYAPLTVHLWKTSGSKTGFTKNGPDLVKGIASTIAQRPDERWLVVAHLPKGKGFNVETAIRRSLPKVPPGNIAVITWGCHMASNEYRDVPNVILAGTLFMRSSYYKAITHLAQGRSVAPGLVPADEIAKTIRGEHANLILQALCRGRVRKSDGDRCHPMNAYIIAAPQSGIHTAVASIFPGCTVRRWTASPAKPLKGRLLALSKIVADRIEKGDTEMTNQSLYEAMGMARQNFGALVRKPEWLAFIADVGLKPQRLKGQVMGMRLAA